jgi:hypothetical protein
VVHHRNGDPSPLQANTTEALSVGISPARGGGSATRLLIPGMLPAETAKAAAETASRARAGLRQPHHEAPSSGQRGDSLRCCRQLPPARNLAPMTPATELNPHKPELNPHQAVPGG